MSSLNRLSRFLFLANRTVRDVNAITRGKIVQRVANRVLGRVASRVLSKVWAR